MSSGSARSGGASPRRGPVGLGHLPKGGRRAGAAHNVGWRAEVEAGEAARSLVAAADSASAVAGLVGPLHAGDCDRHRPGPAGLGCSCGVVVDAMAARPGARASARVSWLRDTAFLARLGAGLGVLDLLLNWLNH